MTFHDDARLYFHLFFDSIVNFIHNEIQGFIDVFVASESLNLYRDRKKSCSIIISLSRFLNLNLNKTLWSNKMDWICLAGHHRRQSFFKNMIMI